MTIVIAIALLMVAYIIITSAIKDQTISQFIQEVMK